MAYPLRVFCTRLALHTSEPLASFDVTDVNPTVPTSNPLVRDDFRINPECRHVFKKEMLLSGPEFANELAGM